MPSFSTNRALAEGHEYFRLGGHAISPDGRLLAYAVDTNGSERFVLKVRDLDTGAELPDLIENWRYGLVWAADSRSFLYTDADEHWRSKTVWHHRLGDQQSADRAIYREPDEKFGVSIGRSQSRAFALISTGDHATNEVYLLPMDDFAATPVLVSPRRTDRRYDVDEREGTLYIRVNDTHPNFRVVTAPVSKPGDWTELIAGDDRHYIQSRHDLRERDGRRGTRRWPVADPAARLFERRRTLCRVPGSELRRHAVAQSRISRRPTAHRLRIDGDAQHGLRLPHRRRPAGNAEGAGNPERLRCVEVCEPSG